MTATLASYLSPTVDTKDGTLVEVVRLPDAPVPAALASLADRLGDPDVVHLGQAARPAKALTTTPNYQDGRRIGLHVDNWDKLAYESKHLGPRRLCFNLGPGTRYLLLGNLDIRAICRTVHPDPVGRYPHTDDLRAYVTRGLPLTLLRLRLDPGEGYIAPPNCCLMTAPPKTNRCRPPPRSGSVTGHAASWPQSSDRWARQLEALTPVAGPWSGSGHRQVQFNDAVEASS